MKKVLTICCLFFSYLFLNPIFAGDELRAGHINLRQISETTVEAKVKLVVEGHANITDLNLCWGDGLCTNFPTLAGVVNEAWNIKTYTLTVMHTYPEVNTFTVSIDHCCFDVATYNMNQPENSNFSLETMIVLQEGLLNSTPDYLGNNITADSAQVGIGIDGAIADPEGDSYEVELCVPANAVNYGYPNEFIPGTPLSFGADNGWIFWENSFFDGIYAVQTCTNEYRNGVLISSSQRIICFMIGETYITDVVSLKESGLKIFPNPVTGDFLFLKNENNTSFEGAELLLINTLQQVVYQMTWDGLSKELNIPVNKFGAGLYHLLVKTNDGEAYYEPIVIVK